MENLAEKLNDLADKEEQLAEKTEQNDKNKNSDDKQGKNEDLKKEITAKISDLGLNSNIELKNEVPFRDMGDYYSRSMVGLGLFHDTPKFNNFIPIKLFEYMAFGLPVIFSDIGIPAAIIKEENCGLTVDIDDINGTADAMIKMILDKSYYGQLSENGKKAVEKKYNWNTEQQKLLKVYKDLIN